jgi:hypothetical protein
MLDESAERDYCSLRPTFLAQFVCYHKNLYARESCASDGLTLNSQPKIGRSYTQEDRNIKLNYTSNASIYGSHNEENGSSNKSKQLRVSEALLVEYHPPYKKKTCIRWCMN